ncbi:MAG: hypothetical protein IEMM0002_1557 [bacterium]|nr:MAG: hypothetical protein IEMM0002_1557 [bacterium]
MIFETTGDSAYRVRRTLLTSKVRLILDEPQNGFRNMAADEILFNTAAHNGDQPVTLRVYRWSRPTITLGRRQNFSVVDFDVCRKYGVDFVKRFGGGAAVYHWEEITYCFVARLDFLPSIMDSDLWRKLFIVFLERLGITPDDSAPRRKNAGRAEKKSANCFSAAQRDEPTINGRKWVGNARRKSKTVFLQHGSILMNPQPTFLQKIAPGMKKDISAGLCELSPGLCAEKAEKAFVDTVEFIFGLSFSEVGYTRHEQIIMNRLEDIKRCEFAKTMASAC